MASENPEMLDDSSSAAPNHFTEAIDHLFGVFMTFKDVPMEGNEIFVRDFVPSALIFLINNNAQLVQNFLLKTVEVQGWNGENECGTMAASFKVVGNGFGVDCEGVRPLDSGFWWIITVYAYMVHTGDFSFAAKPVVNNGIKMIINTCLRKTFDEYPTLYSPDASTMIDRPMGLHGYPFDIQALFFYGMRCAQKLLSKSVDLESKELTERIGIRLIALRQHLQSFYWIDKDVLSLMKQPVADSESTLKKFHVTPASIPSWVTPFLEDGGGYFIGNVSPGRLDFRWFAIGNCISVFSGLATEEQGKSIMKLIASRSADLIGGVPLKVVYPALEGDEWKFLTGHDELNKAWSYHNGGSWPVLLWLLTAAGVKAGEQISLTQTIVAVENRLLLDDWPDYYEGKDNQTVGLKARKSHSLSIAGYMLANYFLYYPLLMKMILVVDEEEGTDDNVTLMPTLPGFVFEPKVYQLFESYLQPKYLGQIPEWDGVKEVDLYSGPPWSVLQHVKWHKDDDEGKVRKLTVYVFARVKQANAKGKARKTSQGTWSTQHTEPVKNKNNQIIGYQTTMAFKPKGEKEDKVSWTMTEYSLTKEFMVENPQPGNADLVICRISRITRS